MLQCEGLPPRKLRHGRDQGEEGGLLAAVRHVRRSRSLVEQVFSPGFKFVILDARFHGVEVLRHVLVNYVPAVSVGDVKVNREMGVHDQEREA
jgi:hypothetical protein